MANRRTLYFFQSPLTNVAAGARSTLNVLGTRIPMVGSERLLIQNYTVGVLVELVADSRLLLLDSMQGNLNLNDTGGNFQSFITLVTSPPLTAGAPIPWSSGLAVAINGDPIITLLPGFTVSDGSTPPAELQLAANLDVHNADAAAHRFRGFISAFIETN